MRFFLLYVFISLQLTLFSQQKVKVRVTYTNSYCGGARPTDEILQKHNTPKVLADYKIKLENKKVVIIKTDSLGCFTHKLNTGKYLIFLTEEKNKTLFLNYNPNCIKMTKASYGELIVKKGETDYEINLHFPCDPCQPANKP
jgi:hypothetical protein